MCNSCGRFFCSRPYLPHFQILLQFELDRIYFHVHIELSQFWYDAWFKLSSSSMFRFFLKIIVITVWVPFLICLTGHTVIISVQAAKKILEENKAKPIVVLGRYAGAYTHIRKRDWWDTNLSGGPIVEQVIIYLYAYNPLNPIQVISRIGRKNFDWNPTVSLAPSILSILGCLNSKICWRKIQTYLKFHFTILLLVTMNALYIIVTWLLGSGLYSIQYPEYVMYL